MKIQVFIIAICILSLSGCSTDDGGQHTISEDFNAEIDWLKTFGGSGEDTAQDIISTSDGGFAVLGYTNSTDGDITDKNLNVNDYWLLKFDKQGNLQWNKTYGGSKDDKGQSIIQTNDGGYAIAGYSMSSDGDASVNQGFHDNWILKVNADGEILWETSFGYSGHDHAYDILQTSNGGYFVAGFLDVTGSGGEGNTGRSSFTAHGVGEFWGSLLNASGEIVWQRYFGGTNNDRAHAVVQANDGGFVLAGFTESDDFDISQTNGSYDFWVLKINLEGEPVWERTFGGSGIDRANDIVKTSDNGYLIVGGSNSTDGMISRNHGNSDVWIIKINDAGKLEWERSYGGTDFDDATHISKTSDEGFIITGNSKSTNIDVVMNQGENDIWAFKIDASGKLLWQKSMGKEGLDLGFGALENPEDKSVIICGELSDTDSGEKNAVIIRLK
ncbi:hypothetical protein ACJD0Z_00800 [Flavobacteriaceae bacterium M23B6Z8]